MRVTRCEIRDTSNEIRDARFEFRITYLGSRIPHLVSRNKEGIIMTRSLLSAISLAGLLLMPLGVGFEALAQEKAQESETELAKKTQNPVADLISIPLQNRMNFGIGPNNRMQNVMNVQPVVPISLNSEWNLITRTIMPIIKQPDIATTNDNTWGIGSTTFTALLSPADPGAVIWGVGPAIQIPTTTEDQLGSRKWGAGPSVVALTMQGHWVYGAIANQVWSIDGSNNRPNTSTFFTNAFLNYNLSDGWYLTSSPIITADWEGSNGHKWTVPVGGGFGKIQRIGRLPFNLSVAAYSNVVRPDPGADWELRLQIALLLPKSLFTK